MEAECILCGGCADICPVACIEILPLEHLTLSENARELVVDRFQFDPEVPVDQRMVLIKHEDICIRCGLCARQCPVGIMIMEDQKSIY